MGLLRADGVEEYLASRGMQVWSAYFLADDWHHISSARVADHAIKRLEADGKGILLLHDIQARTVAALPKILHEMKARGYHIVHVVPATPQQPATPTEPPQWQLHPPSENVPIAHWPKIPNFVLAEVVAFPAPVLPNFDAPDGARFLSGEPFNRARRIASSDQDRQLYLRRVTAPEPTRVNEWLMSVSGTFETCRDVRSSVAIGEIADMARTARFGRD